MKRAALTAVFVASTAHAEPSVEIRCDAAVDRAELAAALAVELRGLDAPAIAVDAVPCAASSPVRVTLDGQSFDLDVPAEIRARTIALLVAELTRAPAERARSPVLSGDRTPAVRIWGPAPDSDTRPLEHRDADGPEVAVSFVRRSYEHPDHNATGARLAIGVSLPLRLRASIDAGVDSIATPYSFDMVAGRLGLQLGWRYRLLPVLALEVGLRGEVLGAQVRPGDDVMVDRRWIGAAGGGVVLAAAVEISRSLAARIEIESASVLAAHELQMGWVGIEAPGVSQPAITGSVALSIGLSIR